MEINKLTPGQILYSAEKRGFGNTTLSTTSVYVVRIVTVADDKQSFEASWNGNPARKYYRVPSTWKAKKPHIIESGMGRQRLAKKEEIAAGQCQECHTYIKVSLP